MTAIMEEKIKKCDECKKNTKHYRNTQKSSGFMILVHLILIICTAGIWLPIILLWKFCFINIGGWMCGSC